MQLARVIGEIVSSIKDQQLSGVPLLVLQPLDAAGEPFGRTLVATDSVGAGVGEQVFFVRGREAAYPFYPAEPPTDAAIIGIVDHVTVDQGALPRPRPELKPKPETEPQTESQTKPQTKPRTNPIT